MNGNNHALTQLTPKQREVLALVADNRTSKEIAGLLGISESAVNQRIEMVRSRVGGLPRGELARLYRQTIAPAATEFLENPDTWQKIQVSDSLATSKGNDAESVLQVCADGSHRSTARKGGGSQLAATLFQADKPWLWRRNSATALVRLAAIAAIIAGVLAFATDMLPNFRPFDF